GQPVREAPAHAKQYRMLGRHHNVRFGALRGLNSIGAQCPTSADCVAKRFCASERARLIQDQAPMRNVDSRIHSTRFDCCVFLFYSFSAVTFATKSANSGLMHRSKQDSHSITSSTRMSIDIGTSSPSAFAVLRLMISS